MPSRRSFLAVGAALGCRWAFAQEPLPDGSTARGMITATSQRAADQGLEYLLRNQHTDGSFGTGQHPGTVAVTSLGALAFMAGGHQVGRGTLGRVIQSALEFVLDQEEGRRGYLHNPAASPHGPMYGHGFGTLFLAEVYGTVHA